MVSSVFPDRQYGVNSLVFLQRQQVNNWFTTCTAAGPRHLVDLQPVNLAATREAQQRVMGISYKQLLDKVFVFNLGRRAAAAATLLRLVGIKPLSFRITGVRQGNNHIFFRNQIFHSEIRMVFDNLGPTLVTVVLTDFEQFFADHSNELVWVFQNLN